MATQVEQVAATQQRQQIPPNFRLEFDDWADKTLRSLSEDFVIDPAIRAYARWELAYRKAFGLQVLLHPETAALVRLDLSEPASVSGTLSEVEAAEARVKARAEELRRRS